MSRWSRPWEEIRLAGRPRRGEIGLGLTFQATCSPSGLRRGTMRARTTWCRTRATSSSRAPTPVRSPRGHRGEVDGWIGSGTARGAPRPRPLPAVDWFQIQLDDGTSGCGTGSSSRCPRLHRRLLGRHRPERPVPVVGFHHDVAWLEDDGKPTEVTPSTARQSPASPAPAFTLADRRAITVEAEGSFAWPYEPFHRGGLGLMRCRYRRRPVRHRDLRGHGGPPPPLLYHGDRSPASSPR